MKEDEDPCFQPSDINGLDMANGVLRVRWTTGGRRGLSDVYRLSPVEKLFVNVFVRGLHIGHPDGPVELWRSLLGECDVTSSKGLDLVWDLFDRTSTNSTTPGVKPESKLEAKQAAKQRAKRLAAANPAQFITVDDAASVVTFAKEMTLPDVITALDECENEDLRADLHEMKAAMEEDGMSGVLDKSKIKTGRDFALMFLDHLVKNRFPRKDFNKVAAIISTLEDPLLASTWIQLKDLPKAPAETPLKKKKELTDSQARAALAAQCLAVVYSLFACTVILIC